MRSETIFKHRTFERGRYDDEYTTTITIASDFSNPAVWPYTLKQVETESDIDPDSDDLFAMKETSEETRSVRLPKDVFEKIKASIESNTALKGCEETVENAVMDGVSDSFFFSCDSYQKSVSGCEIFHFAENEESKPAHLRSTNYTVSKAVDTIIAILKDAGIALYER